MNLKNRMIVEQYRAEKKDYIELEGIVTDILSKAMKEHGMNLLGLSHRVKTEDSLKGKLELKGDKYASLDDLTDILGVRLICFFSDESSFRLFS